MDNGTSTKAWVAYKIGKTGRRLGIVYAGTEAEALAKAVREHGVPANRLVVRSE